MPRRPTHEHSLVEQMVVARAADLVSTASVRSTSVVGV